MYLGNTKAETLASFFGHWCPDPRHVLTQGDVKIYVCVKTDSFYVFGFIHFNYLYILSFELSMYIVFELASSLHQDFSSL